MAYDAMIRRSMQGIFMEDPTLTLEVVSERYGISRETLRDWVRGIRERAGVLYTRGIKPKETSNPMIEVRRCLKCRNSFIVAQNYYRCFACRKSVPGY